jgi:hypothetical protein
MARRKSQKKHHHQRRRVGALGMSKNTLVKVAGAAVGFFLGDTINPMIDSVIPSSLFPTTTTVTPATGFAALGVNQPTIVGTLQIVGGFLIAKGPSKVKNGLGGLLIGLGGQRLLKKAGIVTGYQSVPVIGRRRMAGYQNTPVIAGSGVPPQLSGVPDQLQGFRVNGYGSQGSGVMGKVSGLYSGYGVSGAASGSGISTGSNCMN